MSGEEKTRKKFVQASACAGFRKFALVGAGERPLLVFISYSHIIERAKDALNRSLSA
jgi:hypothetical protein